MGAMDICTVEIEMYCISTFFLSAHPWTQKEMVGPGGGIGLPSIHVMYCRNGSTNIGMTFFQLSEQCKALAAGVQLVSMLGKLLSSSGMSYGMQSSGED